MRNTLLNKADNFNKKACVQKNPEYDEEYPNEVSGILTRIKSSGEVTEEMLSALDEGKIVAIAMMDKILASCRSGKCVMELILVMINMEEKMDVSKALLKPMCKIEGVPVYNESVHMTSYIKMACVAIEKLSLIHI